MTNQAQILKQMFCNSVGLPFERLLGSSIVEKILEEQGVHYRSRLYTPIVVIWAWISQVLEADSSLSNTVRGAIAELVRAGASIPSSNTGAYSKARVRLPLSVLCALLKETAAAISTQIAPEQFWCGRRIKAYDGTSIQMSDTRANQKVYPQHSNQKPGCGFPLAQLVVWFCGRTGAVLDIAIASFKTSEWQLSRQLYATLTSEDVVVADSAYGTYVDLALVFLSQADAVFRKHYGRRCDFRRGKKLGIGDHRVQWQRPPRSPASMTRCEFQALPKFLEVREVHLLIQQPGFRSREIILVTTLLDSKRYPKAKLAELYQLRWSATEVNLKHLKTTLQMEKIAAQTPEMVQKEIVVHLLAYNLLRTVMLQSAQKLCVPPLRISLQGTRQQWNSIEPILARATPGERSRLYRTLLTLIGHPLIPLRSERAEPRVVKRRPKDFPRMQQSRAVFKAQRLARSA